MRFVPDDFLTVSFPEQTHKFAIPVKRGNVRVKIYSTPSNGCDSFVVACRFGGKRIRKTLPDLRLAQLEAVTVANRILRP